MTTVAQRPPIEHARDEAPGRNRPLLTLRLSDGHTWAHEFGASSPAELREGCFEAWVACRIEWQRRADALPTYQTRKRAAALAAMPRALELHVRDTTAPGGAWVNASYPKDPGRKLTIREPGQAPNAEAWDGADWPGAFLRCLRCWLACAELTRFLQSFVRDLDLERRVAEAIQREGER